MKEIKTINNVLSTDHDESNNEIDMLDSHTGRSKPACYQPVVRDMLTPGHGNKLICWLKSFGYIKPQQTYKKARIEETGTSSENNSIRKDSISIDANCTLSIAMEILHGWCKGKDIESMANMLGIKDCAIGELYMEAANVAKKRMGSNIADWQLGGPGIVVIIDTYPEGCTNTNLIRGGRPILCISEIGSIPQKYWLETLDHYQEHNLVQIEAVKEDILRIVQTIVRPGSILILPLNSTLCSHGDFECLKVVYPAIINTRDLARHNQKTLFLNLETIWKSILDVCEVAQFYTSMLIPQYITSHMWRRGYGADAMEILLYELSLEQ